jgi:hypothetical protein
MPQEKRASGRNKNKNNGMDVIDGGVGEEGMGIWADGRRQTADDCQNQSQINKMFLNTNQS